MRRRADGVATQSEIYYAVDPSGKLGWKDSTLAYIDTAAHVIEVLTGRDSNDYKDFLRRLGISHILAGEDKLDYNPAMRKLKERFGIETLFSCIAKAFWNHRHCRWFSPTKKKRVN